MNIENATCDYLHPLRHYSERRNLVKFKTSTVKSLLTPRHLYKTDLSKNRKAAVGFCRFSVIFSPLTILSTGRTPL